MDQQNDSLPDYITDRTHPNVTVKLNGRKVYLATEANRKEGWVKVFITEDESKDNFHPEARPIMPLVDDELRGTVTFHV